MLVVAGDLRGPARPRAAHRPTSWPTSSTPSCAAWRRSLPGVPTWVALLRAVNLGARNKVSMPELRTALADAGFTDVQHVRQQRQRGARLDAALAGQGRAGRARRDPRPLRRGHPGDDADRSRSSRRCWTGTRSRSGGRAPAPGRGAAPVRRAARPSGCETLPGRRPRADPGRAPGRARSSSTGTTATAGRGRPGAEKLGVDATARNWRTLTALWSSCHPVRVLEAGP